MKDTYLPSTNDFYSRNNAERTSYLFATGSMTDYMRIIPPTMETPDRERLETAGCQVRLYLGWNEQRDSLGESHGGANIKTSSHYGPGGCRAFTPAVTATPRVRLPAW